VLRGRDLSQWLAPSGEDAIRPHVASLVLSLKHRSEDEETSEAKQRIFAADLADLPLFAVEAACADFRQGRAGDGVFMPTQAEVRKVALRRVQKLRDELADVRSILAAEVVEPVRSEKSRKEIADECRRMVSEAAAKAGLSQVTPAEAQAALDRLASEPPQPPVMSDALRAALSKPRGHL
jgi:hypothetical protein